MSRRAVSADQPCFDNCRLSSQVARTVTRVTAVSPPHRSALSDEGPPQVRTSQHDPAISVVMPVHNALPYLDEAVESILGQSRDDFEFVTYDDASTDGSADRLEHWAARDSRIRLIRGKRR